MLRIIIVEGVVGCVWDGGEFPWPSSGQASRPHATRAYRYALANRGPDTRALQAYLGHKNIQHTVRYTELSPDRFKDFWR